MRKGIITCSDNAFLGLEWAMKNYECLIKHECKRCLKRKECHLGCSSPKEFRVLKKTWGGERMRSYSGLWDRQTYQMLRWTKCLCSLTTLDWVPGALHRYTPSLECVIVACNDKGQVTIHSWANGKKLALYRSAMLDKKSFVYFRWNCMSKRNRRAVWPRKILLSFGVNWWSATCYWEYVWCCIFLEG